MYSNSWIVMCFSIQFLFEVLDIDEGKAKNVGYRLACTDKLTQTRYFLFTKHSEGLYPLDVRTDKISWKIEMKAISKAKKKLDFYERVLIALQTKLRS